MKLDKLIEIYQLFFPGKSYETRCSNDMLEGSTKYSAVYDEVNNHIEVCRYDFYNYCPLFTYTEGSPEDIIKLSKILQGWTCC